MLKPPLLLCTLLVTSVAAPALPQVARGDRVTFALPSPRPTARIERIPDEGYAHIERVVLPQLISTPLLALPSGGFALAMATPSRIGFIAANGHLGSVAALDEPISQPLLAGLDGRVLAAGEGRNIYVVTPDGAVRNTVALANRTQQGFAVRPDGSMVIAVASQAASHELVIVSADGDHMESRALAGAPQARPTLDHRGNILVPYGSSLGRLDARGHWSSTGFAPAVTDIVTLDDGTIVAVSEGTVLLARASGVITARVDLGLRPLWLAPLPHGRIVALKVGPPSELWLIDSSGRSELRGHLPIASAPPMIDETGAMLVLTRDGGVIALDPDGGARWHMALNEPLRPPAVALPGGGFAVATSQRSVLLVR